MQTRIQVYTDEDGNKSSIIVSFEDWTKLTGKIKKLEDRLKVFSGIHDGIREVKQSRNTGKTLQTLSDFVNECRD